MDFYNIGFIMEQALGHVTHTKNLQQNIQNDPEVRAHWGLIPFETSGVGSHIPIYNSNWTVRAGLRARSTVANLARTTRLDALFFHTQVPAVLSIDWLRRMPSVVSLDATPRQYDRLGTFYGHTPGPAWLEDLKWRLNRNCYRAAGQIVAWSRWTKQGLIEEYETAPDKITVIPPGVNVRDWIRSAPRQRHTDPVKILFVGANLERKGGTLLLDAFRALRSRGVELHLVTKDHVAPEPGLFVYNTMQANSAPLRALYHACDIFALPTFGDCLPMVLSEAGAAGMAIVSTDVAAIPEIVRDNETGLVVPVGNATALQEALRSLVMQPERRLRLGERAINHVSREYDAQKNAGRLLDLLKGEVEFSRMKVRIAV